MPNVPITHQSLTLGNDVLNHIINPTRLQGNSLTKKEMRDLLSMQAHQEQFQAAIDQSDTCPTCDEKVQEKYVYNPKLTKKKYALMHLRVPA